MERLTLERWALAGLELPRYRRDEMLGGHAVHGHPRATKDLDVLVRAVPANAGRSYRALASFGAPLEAIRRG